MSNIKELLIKKFGKDVTSIIIPYISINCYNCRKMIFKYHLCTICYKKFCNECYTDDNFPCDTVCTIYTHFNWH